MISSLKMISYWSVWKDGTLLNLLRKRLSRRLRKRTRRKSNNKPIRDSWNGPVQYAHLPTQSAIATVICAAIKCSLSLLPSKYMKLFRQLMLVKPKINLKNLKTNGSKLSRMRYWSTSKVTGSNIARKQK